MAVEYSVQHRQRLPPNVVETFVGGSEGYQYAVAVEGEDKGVLKGQDFPQRVQQVAEHLFRATGPPNTRRPLSRLSVSCLARVS